MYGAAPATGGDAEGPPNDVWQHLRAFDDHAVFCRGFEQAALLDGREGALAFVDDGDIGGKDNHRNGGTSRLRDSWNHVRRAATAGRFRNPWTTGKASVRVGHEARRA